MADKPQVVVRALLPSDKEEWSRMWKAYLAFYGTTRPQEIYDVFFERLLGDNQRDFNCLIAEVNAKPVGLTHYLFHRHGWSVEDVCYLQDLYADPEARGLGVGRALIQAVYDAADAAGAPSVYWLTQDFNAPARLLYDRIGAKTPFIKYNRA